MNPAPERLARIGTPALIAAAVAATGAALWPALSSIAGNWVEIHDYQHGFLIAPLALAWLLWAAWQARARPLQPAPAALAALAATLVLWLVALRAHSDIAMEVLLPPVAWLAVAAAVGWQAARTVAAPIAFLYFAIPVWEFLLPALQWLAVHVTEAALAFAGIPAEVSAYLVTLPAGSFEIVEGCSGKRYFVVGLALSVIAGVFRQLHGWRLAALVAFGGALALVANWLRIFVVIAAGHLSDMQHYLVAVEHRTFGNVVFAALLLAIYVAASLAGRRFAPARDAAATPRASAVRAAARIAPAAAAPFLALGAAAAMVQLPAQAAGTAAARLGPLPVVAAEWQGPLPPSASWSPRFAGPDAELRASYRRSDGGTIQLYLNLYRWQEPGKELLGFRNELLAPGSWARAWPHRLERLDAQQSPALAALEAQGPAGDRWLLAYVYKIGGTTAVRAPLAQAAYGLQSLLRPAPAGIVAMSVQCSENCQEARALVQVFWQDMSSSVLGMIPDDVG